MSENIIIALCTLCSGIFSSAITAFITHKVSKTNKDITASELLLKSEHQLNETIKDAQKLWQWNRELVDHIYSRNPPPPPEPPKGLFNSKETEANR